MLWSLNHLRSYRLRATDDTLGAVEDVFFDDSTWTVRYLVVETGFLLGHRVLLAPAVLGHPDAVSREFPIALTKEQIRNSPDIDTAQPVSRQQEIDLHGYYGWTPYWGASAWIAGPAIAAQQSGQADGGGGADPARDPHLRSGRELIGYGIRETDGALGSVSDLLIDEAGWVVRYLVVDTGHWLPGRKVLLAPGWVTEISWAERSVLVGLTRAAIESSPEYSPGAALERDYEDRLHQHYGRTGYWTTEKEVRERDEA